MNMLGTGSSSAADERRERVRSLKQRLARLKRQLREVNNDVGVLGDDPYRMGAAFIEEGDGDSDDEYEEFYARDSIRSATGSYSAWAADRLLTVFKMFDEDGDKQLNLREFRHFLLKTGTLDEFDMVCGSESEFKACLEPQFDTGSAGNLAFTGFLQLCADAWPDEQLIRMCKTLGVELRYRFDTEQHRVLTVFKQFEPDARGRIRARHFQLLAYECGCLLTEKAAREAAAICVTETQKHDRESKIDPKADEVGKTELDSDEISDDESKKRPSQRKPKYVKGRMAFHPFLQWWHEIGFAQACAQRRTLKNNLSMPVRELRLKTWLAHKQRHIRGLYHLFREHFKQSIVAGVFDRQRARMPQETRSRVVVSGSMGRPRSAGAAGTPVSINFQAQRTSIPEAWEHAGVPADAKAFIDIQFDPDVHTTEVGLRDVYTSCEETLRMDVRSMFKGFPGFMDARPRLTSEEGVPLFAICVYLSSHPFAALDALRDHLESRMPAAFSSAKSAADLRADEEEERMAGSDKAAAAPKRTHKKEVPRVSSNPHSGVTASKRGKRRQAAMKAATALATANLGKKVFAVPKTGKWRPVLREMSVRLSSSFSLADFFSEGASFARVVQWALDGALEVDTQLLAGFSDALYRVFEYVQRQWELGTPGRPAGATTTDRDRHLLLRKVMKKVAMSAMESGLGFFASTDAALRAEKLAGMFKSPERNESVPRRSVDGSGFRAGFKTRLVLGVLKLARLLRRTQDVQLKWQSSGLLRTIRSSRFLRSVLSPAQASRFEESIQEVGYPAQCLKDMRAWYKEQVDSFKANTGKRRSSAVGMESSSEEDDDAHGAGAGAGASAYGGPTEEEMRGLRIYRALTRLTNNLKGIYKVVFQIGEFRFEMNCTNLDIFTLLRKPTERVGRKTANAKAKANIKRDENML